MERVTRLVIAAVGLLLVAGSLPWLLAVLLFPLTTAMGLAWLAVGIGLVRFARRPVLWDETSIGPARALGLITACTGAVLVLGAGYTSSINPRYEGALALGGLLVAAGLGVLFAFRRRQPLRGEP